MISPRIATSDVQVIGRNHFMDTDIDALPAVDEKGGSVDEKGGRLLKLKIKPDRFFNLTKST